MKQSPYGLEGTPSTGAAGGANGIDYTQAVICEHQLNYEKHIVIEASINRDGKAAPPRVIQACTESLDHKIFEGKERFFLLADRAGAYFAEGDKQHALDDYTEAITLAPHNAELYYNRGVLYAAQFDGEAALRDFDAAITPTPIWSPRCISAQRPTTLKGISSVHSRTIRRLSAWNRKLRRCGANADGSAYSNTTTRVL